MEILEGGAKSRRDRADPDRGQRAAPLPASSRAVTAKLTPGPRRHRWLHAVLDARTPGGTRWVAIVLVAAVLLGGGWLLRAGAGGLESSRDERSGAPGPAGSAAGTAPDSEAWGSPVLPPGAGFTLAVQTEDRLVRIEHGRDGTALVPLPATAAGVRASLDNGGWVTAGETVMLVPGPGGLGQSAVVLPREGRAPVRIGPGARILPGAHGWTAWVLRAAGAGRWTLQGYALTGAARGPAVLVPAGREPVAVLRDSVVLTAPDGGLALWRPGRGDADRLAVSGRVVSAVQDRLVVAEECPRGPACRHWLVNTSSKRVTRLADAPELRPLGEPVLSRDGLWVAAMVDPDPRDGRPEAALAVATVFDAGARPLVVAGTRYLLAALAQVSEAVQPAWSLDGRVFGAAPSAIGLYGYQPGERGARRLDVPGLGSVTRIVAG